MAKFPSKRNQLNPKPATRIPEELRRQHSDPFHPDSVKNGKIAKGARKPVDYMARVQCVGLSKNKLKIYWLNKMSSDGIQGLPAVDDPQWRYSEITELARTKGYDTDKTKLPMDVRISCRCSKHAIAGGMVCRHHGGSIKAVMANARENFYAMINPAQKRLIHIISKGKHEPAVVAAIKELHEVTGLHKPEINGTDQGYSEELIRKMADVFTEEQLDTYIKLSRMLQSALPEDDSEESNAKRLIGEVVSDKLNTVQVGPAKMAELIKTSKRTVQ